LRTIGGRPSHEKPLKGDAVDGPRGVGAGHFEFEMASPLPREKLFAWYTDFSEEDSELSKTYANGSLLARSVRHTDDGHIICEQRMKIGRMEMPGQARIVLHPGEFNYDAELEIGNLVTQKRLYEFLEKDGGTVLHVKVDYTPKAMFVKFLDAIGMYKRIDRKESLRTMAGYFKAAEAELGGKGPSGRPL
jgi:hypothetical protein